MKARKLQMSRKSDVEKEINDIINNKDMAMVAQLKPEYAMKSLNVSLNAKIAVLLAELVDKVEGVKTELANINATLNLD